MPGLDKHLSNRFTFEGLGLGLVGSGERGGEKQTGLNEPPRSEGANMYFGLLFT